MEALILFRHATRRPVLYAGLAVGAGGVFGRWESRIERKPEEALRMIGTLLELWGARVFNPPLEFEHSRTSYRAYGVARLSVKARFSRATPGFQPAQRQ